MSKRDYY
jgi:DnaJ family protein B protein 6